MCSKSVTVLKSFSDFNVNNLQRYVKKVKHKKWFDRYLKVNHL